MRKLIVTNLVSLDGYIDGPGKNPMALPMDDPFFNQHNLERMRAADTLMLGRTGFEGAVQFWPTADGNTMFDEVTWETARLNNAVEKFVVSDSMKPDQLGAWSDTTTIVSRADAPAKVRELKAGDGGDIMVFGSGTMWNGLMEAGVVDEVNVLVAPVTLGGGTPNFTAPPSSMRLIDSQTRDGSQLVLLRYDARPAGQ